MRIASFDTRVSSGRRAVGGGIIDLSRDELKIGKGRKVQKVIVCRKIRNLIIIE